MGNEISNINTTYDVYTDAKKLVDNIKNPEYRKKIEASFYGKDSTYSKYLIAANEAECACNHPFRFFSQRIRDDCINNTGKMRKHQLDLLFDTDGFLIQAETLDKVYHKWGLA